MALFVDSADDASGDGLASFTAFDPDQFLQLEPPDERHLLDLSGRELTNAGLKEDVLFFQNAVELDVSRNALTGFPLISWHLQSLTLSHNNLGNLASLRQLPNLIYLDVSHNRLTNTRGVHHNSKLEVLLLNNNRIRKLEDVNTLSKLDIVDLSFNDIASLDSIRWLHLHLRRLSLVGNPVCANTQNLRSRVLLLLPALEEFNGEVLVGTKARGRMGASGYLAQHVSQLPRSADRPSSRASSGSLSAANRVALAEEARPRSHSVSDRSTGTTNSLAQHNSDKFKTPQSAAVQSLPWRRPPDITPQWSLPSARKQKTGTATPSKQQTGKAGSHDQDTLSVDTPRRSILLEDERRQPATSERRPQSPQPCSGSSANHVADSYQSPYMRRQKGVGSSQRREENALSQQPKIQARTQGRIVSNSPQAANGGGGGSSESGSAKPKRRRRRSSSGSLSTNAINDQYEVSLTSNISTNSYQARNASRAQISTRQSPIESRTANAGGRSTPVRAIRRNAEVEESQASYVEQEQEHTRSRGAQQLRVFMPNGQLLHAHPRTNDFASESLHDRQNGVHLGQQAWDYSSTGDLPAQTRKDSFYSTASAVESELFSSSHQEDDNEDDVAAIALQAMIRQKRLTLDKLRKLRETPPV